MCKLEVFGVIEEINDYEKASGYYDQRVLMLPDLMSLTIRDMVFDFAFFPISSWTTNHTFIKFHKPPSDILEISKFFCLVEISTFFFLVDSYMIDSYDK